MPDAPRLAATPPMGWNSFDCFGSAVVEYEVRANADYMARMLVHHGWQYIVVDFCWSHPAPAARPNPDLEIDEDGQWSPLLTMDPFGRLLPAPNRFPSAADGLGFTPLANYVHNLGLSFGLHVMRGIPRQAVAHNLPILHTNLRAGEIADVADTCGWLNHMYGVDMTKPGAQAYYDSLFELYASWGVDYVKVDDIGNPYRRAEIEAIRRAIDACGRPIVLSLSPGGVPLTEADHVSQHANLWRICGDFWDSWTDLRQAFDLCRSWVSYHAPDQWPDADMLPLGRIALRGPMGEPRWTRLTPDEQLTLVTLFCMARSPLMFGGHLPDNDDFTRALISNDEVLAINQYGIGNRELFRRDQHIVWIAKRPGTPGRYVALFNLDDEAPTAISVTWEELSLEGICRVRDLWHHEDLGAAAQGINVMVPPHGTQLYWISPVQR